MTLSVDAGQLALAARAGVSCLPLVVLETFSDRDAGTVANRYYWTRGTPLVYQWDGVTDSIFQPVVVSVTPTTRGFEHIPDASSFSTRESSIIEMDATDRGGARLWKTLLADNLIGARVTIASLLVDFSHAHDDPRYFDLSSLGAVHSVRWRGEVTRPVEFSGDMLRVSMHCESEETFLAASEVLVGGSGGQVPAVFSATDNIPAVPYQHAIGAVVTEINGDTFTVQKLSPTDVVPEWYTLGHGLYGAGLETAGGIVYGSNQSFYAAQTEPGAGGAGTVDLEGVLVGTDAVSWALPIVTTLVRLPAFRVRWALAAGRIAKLSRLQMDSVLQKFGIFGEDLINRSTTTPIRWQLFVDEDIAGGPITFIEFYPDRDQEARATRHNFAADSDDVSMVADIDSVYAEPSGSTWTTIMDPATYALTEPRMRITGVFDTQSVVEKTGSSTVPSPLADDLQIQRVSGDIEITHTDPPNNDTPILLFYFQVNIVPATAFDNDVEIEITLNFTAAEAANCKRIFLLAQDENHDPADGRGSMADGFLYVDGADVTSGDNVFRFPCIGPDDVADITVTVLWIDPQSTDAAIRFSDVIRTRPLTIGAAKSHPTDVVSEVVSQYAASSQIGIDAATFATAKTNTPDLSVRPDLNTIKNLGDLLARVGFNSRTNFVFAESAVGTVIKAFTAETDYEFPAATRDIATSELREVIPEYRTLTEIANSFRAFYGLMVGKAEEESSNYTGELFVSASANPISSKVPTADLTASELAYGKRSAVDLPFDMTFDADAVQDVMAYYISESLRGSVPRYSAIAPRAVAYDLEPGDIVTIHPVFESAPVKVRVIWTTFNYDGPEVGLVFESVR